MLRHSHDNVLNPLILMRSIQRISVISTLGLLLATSVHGQSSPDAEADSLRNLYGTGAGFEVVVTNSGFGLGGYYLHAIDGTYSFLTEISLGSEKSEREVKFFGLGQSFIPDKANYFIRVPIRIGIQKRMWQEYIEDNFRPYMQLTVGPTLGWMYPYFDDDNGNEIYDRDEKRYDGIGSILKGDFRFGFGGVVGIGAHFGENTRLTQGVRIAYSFNYFLSPIQLLEAAEQIDPAQFFGGPSISITFGRIF